MSRATLSAIIPHGKATLALNSIIIIIIIIRRQFLTRRNTTEVITRDQSSSRGREKFGKDILTSPEVIRAETLHFKPNFKFSRYFCLGGGTPSQLWCALARLGQFVTRVKI